MVSVSATRASMSRRTAGATDGSLRESVSSHPARAAGGRARPWSTSSAMRLQSWDTSVTPPQTPAATPVALLHSSPGERLQRLAIEAAGQPLVDHLGPERFVEPDRGFV